MAGKQQNLWAPLAPLPSRSPRSSALEDPAPSFLPPPELLKLNHLAARRRRGRRRLLRTPLTEIRRRLAGKNPGPDMGRQANPEASKADRRLEASAGKKAPVEPARKAATSAEEPPKPPRRPEEPSAPFPSRPSKPRADRGWAGGRDPGGRAPTRRSPTQDHAPVGRRAEPGMRTRRSRDVPANAGADDAAVRGRTGGRGGGVDTVVVGVDGQDDDDDDDEE